MLSGGEWLKRPERALVLLKPQYLGDAVMACPLIDSVAAVYAETVVMCGPLVTEVLQDRADKVRFKTGEKISGIAPVLRAARRLRTLGINHAYLVNRSFRSALALRLSGIPVRVGHATEGRGFLLTNRVPYDSQKFEAACYLDLARAMNVSTADPKPRLCVSDDEKATAFPLLEGAEIGVQPGARYPLKQVPMAVMAEVVSALLSRGRKVVLLGGPDEVSQAQEFQALLNEKCVNLAGQLPIRQTLGTLANLKLMLGSDTGLLHLAAAVGCPTVSVFGPNPASKWGHDYAPHKVIEAPDGDIRKVTAKTILESCNL